MLSMAISRETRATEGEDGVVGEVGVSGAEGGGGEGGEEGGVQTSSRWDSEVAICNRTSNSTPNDKRTHYRNSLPMFTPIQHS